QPVATPVPLAAGADASVVDAPPVTDDEKLAAIQKAMNELAPASQQCWAAAAAVRFDIEGELAAMIEIGPPTKVSFVRDTTRHPELAACVQKLLEAYPWAPPLRGQAIQLPFSFKAPDGQSVIDRRLVPFAGQGKTSVAVLLDENNSNNPMASMFDVAIAAGGSTGLRSTPRAELWFALGPIALGTQKLARFDLAYVPANGAREVRATGSDAHAIVIAIPGQPEGAARAGALPTPEFVAGGKAAAPVIIPLASAKVYCADKTARPCAAGEHDIYLEKPMAAALAIAPAGTTIPPHVHTTETELVYVIEGGGTFSIDGKTIAVSEFSVIQIPPGTKHAFTTNAPTKLFQVYTPGGPEQRWK
ncbi:MAG TPA: cupin domain-containing protein, partial [Kofleriaceae bacterium]